MTGMRYVCVMRQLRILFSWYHAGDGLCYGLQLQRVPRVVKLIDGVEVFDGILIR